MDSSYRSLANITLLPPPPAAESIISGANRCILERDQEHNPRRPFFCSQPGCSRRCTSQYTLSLHLKSHEPKIKTTYLCTGCSETFSRQHDRLRHEVAKHGKICEYLCDQCGRFFSSQRTLGNHKCPAAKGFSRWVSA